MSSDNTVLISDGPYMYLPNATTELHTYNVTVPANDCYKFVIYDSYGNGICCEDGDGYYRITDESGNVLIDELGQFTTEKYSVLSVVQGESVEEMTTPLYNIYPNPVKDVLTIKGKNMSLIKIYNSLGQIVKTLECNEDIVEINFENLHDGIYFINIVDVDGSMKVEKVMK